MKFALLIIDLQKDCFKGNDLENRKDNIVAKVNQLVDDFRAKDLPVIWVRQEFKEDGSDMMLYDIDRGRRHFITGTEGVELIDGLNYVNSDLEIIKNRFSAFFKTDLDANLKELGVDTLVVAGVNTMTCVRTTSIDAYQRDYRVILATECVDGYDIEQHENSLKYLQFAVTKGMNNIELTSI
jgi:nicotinamidase-related amidase